MDAQSPRARAPLFGLLLVIIAGLATARLLLAPHTARSWQAFDALAGTIVCVLVLVCAHGWSLLCRARRSWGVLIVGNALFSAYWYTGRVPSYRRFIAPHVGASVLAPIYPMLYLAAGSVLYRTLLPFAGARLLWKLTPEQLGARQSANEKPPAVRPLWPAYLLLYLIALPFVVLASTTRAFKRRYPFYRHIVSPSGHIALSHFALAQLAYLTIFATGEGFWRGFLIFGTEQELGLYSLPLMVVPYVTAHFGKPLAETLGAIIAGVILGWLALKHRSYWHRTLLHYAIAFTMDLLAIRGHGYTLR